MIHNLLNGRNYLSPNAQSVLTRYGNSIISQIEINRANISKFTLSALNTASIGHFGDEMKNKKIDNLFHLSLYLHTNNGCFKLEKNKVVHLNKTNKKPSQPNESKFVPSCNQITLQDFIENGIKRMGVNSFFKYSAKDSNCQDFVMNLLHTNGINSDDDFIKQDTDSLFDVPNLPQNYMRKLTNFVTDIGHVGDVMQQGEGIVKGKGNCSSTGRRRRQVQPLPAPGINIEEDNYFRRRGMTRDFTYKYYKYLFDKEYRRCGRLFNKLQIATDPSEIANLNDRIDNCINQMDYLEPILEEYSLHNPDSNNNSINESENEEIMPATHTTTGGSIIGGKIYPYHL